MNFRNLRYVRALQWAAATVLLLGLLVWAASTALTPWLKQQAELRASVTLGRTVSLGSLALRPFSLGVDLRDLKVAMADGQGAQLAVDRIAASISWESLWRLAPVVDSFEINHPQLQLSHTGGGHYDVDDLLRRFQPDPNAAPDANSDLPRFALYNMVVRDGAINFTDRGQRSDHQVLQQTVRKLDFSLPFISTLPSKRDVFVRPRLAFALNGSGFDSDAQVRPFAAPKNGVFDLRIAHLDLAPYLPYWPAVVPLRLQAGVIDADLRFDFSQASQTTLGISGPISLTGVRVADTAGAPLVAWNALALDLAAVQPFAQSVELRSVTLKQATVYVARNAQGTLNWLRTLQPSPAPTPAHSTPPSASNAPWHVALAQLHLEQNQIVWRDATLTPAAQWNAGLDLTLHQFAWPVQNGAGGDFQGALTLSRSEAKDHKVAHLAWQGQGGIATGRAEFTLGDADLNLGAPYIAQYLVPALKGIASARGSVAWHDGKVQATLAQAALRDVALAPPNGASPTPDLPSFQALELQNAALDFAQQTARIDQITLHAPRAVVQRSADGSWQFAHWLRSPTVPSPAAASQAPWTANVGVFSLDNGSLALQDQQTVKPVQLQVSGLQVAVRNISLDGKQPAPFQVQAALRSGRTDPGHLQLDGKLAWAPLRLDAQIDATQLPLQAIAPYVMEKVRVELVRADTSFKGQVHYTEPSVQVRGSLAVDDFKANSFQSIAANRQTTEGAETLLSWSRLAVPDLQLQLPLQGAEPPQVHVGAVTLSDLYARLLVDPSGHLVLQNLVSTPVAPPVAAKAAAADAPLNAVIDAGPLRLVNGQVAFTDRFIQPNYSAELTDLNGTLGRVSSRPQLGLADVGALELHGRAQGTASLSVLGRLNPLAHPLDLDLQAQVHDLELSPLSSYAAKYAGYGIERGVLSVDLNYRVTPDSHLSASNHIVLNQLTFGDAVAGASSNLPVKLAVALLADRQGVINLNLPITGSLNDPQFSMWPVIWKVIGNVITKAITAPFSLFSGGDGDATDLGTVAFAPGTAALDSAGRATLDRLAKTLQDRPGLQLHIVGTAGADAEDAAVRRAILNRMVLAEVGRLDVRSISPTTSPSTSPSADTNAVTYTETNAETKASALRSLYRRADMVKPRNAIGLTRDLEPAQMEALLMKSFAITPASIQALALQRAVAVRDYLAAGGVASAQLAVDPGKVLSGPEYAGPQARLDLVQR